MIDIKLDKIGTVKGNILWVCGKFVKITYSKYVIFPFIFKKKTEIFHIHEILNFDEIYGSDYVIKQI
jgi:hypothetical protein